MLDSETHIYGPNAYRKGEERTVVAIKTQGLELQLFFDDPGRKGPLRELRLLPDRDELETKVLRRLVPQAPLYLAYARAAMSSDDENWRGTIEALRKVDRPGRGLSPDFYRVVANSYAAIVAEGEPHPVKALGEMHHVSISAASRWITEARRRGYIAK